MTRTTTAMAKDAIEANALDVLRVESPDGKLRLWQQRGTPAELCDRIDRIAQQMRGPFVIHACKSRDIGQKGKRAFSDVALSWLVDTRSEAVQPGAIAEGMNGLPPWALQELIEARVERRLREFDDEDDDEDDDGAEDGPDGIQGIGDLVRQITDALKPQAPKMEVVKDAAPVSGASDRVPFTRDEAAELLGLLGRLRKDRPGDYDSYLDMIRTAYGRKAV